MKIVIDAMGGDNAPDAIVNGAVSALKKYEDLQIILTGKKEMIESSLKGFCCDRLFIEDCRETIQNDESPTTAIRQKTDSSLVKAFDILKQNKADALISAGSTGAILAGGYLKIGRIKGVSRPALAPILPTKNGKKVMLIDCGANVDSKPINLLDFAIMGSCYMKIFGIENPSCALLSVGDEQGKGNELTKEAYNLLCDQSNKINFVGNKEARDLLAGVADIFVSDGFAGNVALKASEGAVSLAMSELKHAFGGFGGKLAALLIYKKLKKIKEKLDYNKYGGSMFLGCNAIIIKSHGSSNAETILKSIEQARNIYDNKIIEQITQKMNQRLEENDE